MGLVSVRLCCAVLLLAAPMPALGQEGEPPPAQPAAPDLPSLAGEVLSRLSESERAGFGSALEQVGTIEESRRQSARDLLNAMLTDLRSIETALAKIADLEQRVANAPALIEQILAELAQPPTSVDPPSDQTIAQLESGLAQAEAELRAAREDATALEREAELRTRLREEIPTIIARARQEIQRLDDEITAASATSPTEVIPRLELLRLLVQRRSIEQSIVASDREQQSIEARRDSLRARQDRATRRVTTAERRVEAWRARLNEAREAEARRVAAEAKQALRRAANEHESIKALLEERTELAALHERLVGQFQQVQRQRQALEAQMQAIRAEFLRSFEEIERAGLTNTVGIILGLRRSELPSLALHEQQIRRRQQQLAESLSTQFAKERRRDEVKDIGVAVERLLAGLDDSISAEQRSAITERATEEYRAVSELLGKIIETSRDLSEQLSEADAAERALVAVTREYATFIDARILWIRSTKPLSWSDLNAAGEHALRFGRRSLWVRSWTTFRESVTADPASLSMLVIPAGAWLLLLLSSGRIVRAREHLADELTRDKMHPSFRPTYKAMGLVLLSSLRWPALLLLVSLVMRVSAEAPAAVQAIARGLQSASFIWLALEVARQACSNGGFAEVHLRWPREATTALRRHLLWFVAFVVPAEVAFRIVNSEGHELSSEPLARLLFIAGMLVLFLFIQRTLRPHGPVLRAYFDPIRGGWLARLSGVWFVVLLLLPPFLAALTGLGYFYSAQRLQASLSKTILLGLFMVIISALFYRWLWVARRRVAIDQALKRRENIQQQAESDSATTPDVNYLTEDEIDLPAANAQTIQLFRSAAVLTTLLILWAIWIDVLPALGVLERFQVWPRFGPVEMAMERPASLSAAVDSASPRVTSGDSAAPAPSTGGSDQVVSPVSPMIPQPGPSDSSGAGPAAVESVTVADLMMAIIIGVITLVLTRNIPGLLEIAVLQRLPLDAGSRYAISTIVRYVIVIVGVAVTFGAIGIGWSKIQWLAAALTFGLAFGLQEIFANFISGLIILVERPMRVGDTVTIGNISGEVSRIRMRATTITEWNRKELIVPNKEFITGQLINWTLSDPTLRVEIPVGIAYGSDTRLARSLLLKVANKCEFALSDPPPRAVFVGFGENALNFELRIFIPHIRHFVDARDFVNYGIDDEFRKAGIEIAFPQRDIHIRTIDGVLPIERRGAGQAPQGHEQK